MLDDGTKAVTQEQLQSEFFEWRKPTRAIVLLVLAVFAVGAIISLGRAIWKSDSTDFHSYWYSGLFLRQRVDPYYAYFKDLAPSAPIRYLGGQIDTEATLKRDGLMRIPANTAPEVLLLSLFSFLPWTAAKALWLICNVLFAILIPFIVVRIWPAYHPFQVDWKFLFLVLSFFSITSTRGVISNGQTTLFVFVLMLLSIMLADRHWLVAGLFLGIALSKYSLSLPLIFFFLFKRQYRIVLVALFTQVLGVLVLSLLTDVSPLQMLNEYFLMLKLHSDNIGIQLSYLLPDTKPWLIPLILSLLVLGFTGYTVLFRYYKLSLSNKSFFEFHLLCILFLWVLLVAYHMEYDAVLFVLFVCLIVYGSAENKWKLPAYVNLVLMFFLGVSLLWMSRPSLIALTFLPEHFARLWIQGSRSFVTIILFISITIAQVLLYNIPLINGKDESLT
jgi:hypothetical protein